MLVLALSAVAIFSPSESARKTWFLRSASFPFTLTHLQTTVFHFIINALYIIFGYLSFFLLFKVSFGCNLVDRNSGMLVSGARPCCTRHPRSPLELTRSLERPSRLPDAPEPSGTRYTISYDSHPFCLGHPHPSTTRSITLLVVVYWKSRLLVAR